MTSLALASTRSTRDQIRVVSRFDSYPGSIDGRPGAYFIALCLGIPPDRRLWGRSVLTWLYPEITGSKI